MHQIVRINFDDIWQKLSEDSTLWAIKKRDTFIFVITLANIDRFS